MKILTLSNDLSSTHLQLNYVSYSFYRIVDWSHLLDGPMSVSKWNNHHALVNSARQIDNLVFWALLVKSMSKTSSL